MSTSSTVRRRARKTTKTYRPHLTTASHATAVRTRVALRSALLELLKAETFDQISIRDICAKADVGYTTFFRHHPDKAALLSELATSEVQELVNHATPAVASMDLRAAMLSLCQYVDKRRSVWTTLLTGGAAGAVRAEFLRVADEITNSQDWPESRLPAEAGIILIVTGVVELLAWWLRQDNPLPAEQLAEILDRNVVTPNVGDLLGTARN